MSHAGNHTSMSHAGNHTSMSLFRHLIFSPKETCLRDTWAGPGGRLEPAAGAARPQVGTYRTASHLSRNSHTRSSSGIWGACQTTWSLRGAGVRRTGATVVSGGGGELASAHLILLHPYADFQVSSNCLHFCCFHRLFLGTFGSETWNSVWSPR